jgi:predicted amidohydrolase YtcJ
VGAAACGPHARLEGSAWFVFDHDQRGALVPGKLADLVVLSKDYLTIPVEEIGTITSVLTMVGGRIVCAADPYAALEEKVPAN